MKKKIICFDIDNTICKTLSNKYKFSKPYLNKIQLINYLYDNNYYIKLFTSRYMGRNNEKKKFAIQQGFKFTKKQLKTWKIKHHELIFGKPSFDLYIDDKNLGFDKNWHKILKKKLNIKNS